MNIGFTPNYQSMNINRTPNFGMAVVLEEKAVPVIKKELVKLSDQQVSAFWEKINNVRSRQASNPVDINITKNLFGKIRAKVIDSSNPAAKGITTKRRLFEGKGNLNFLDRAEHQANVLNKSNIELSEIL